MNDSKHNSLAGKKIGFFGKGGAGKSTAVVLVSRALARNSYTVCIVDADSTNMGLHRALGIDHPPKAMIDFFGGMIFSGGSVTCPVDDPTPLGGAEIALDKLPSEFVSQAEPNVYLLSCGKLGEWGAGAGCDGPISKIARDIRVSKDSQPVVTLVDFKAGFEDTARGVVTRMDWAIVIIDPTQASLSMALHMKRMVEGVRNGRLPATAHLESDELVSMANRLFQESPLQRALFILNRIRDEKTEAFLKDALATRGIKTLGVIHDDPGIGEAWLTGATMNDSKSREEVDRIVQAFEKVAETSRTGLSV